ncbi:HAD family hydrolase [Pseudomonas sp. NPDC089734]|uniref:HAD family hydrolase n=1 Tax=Pseudomonas sp. NPDC089734 TaxID=3364469 RepID=UPI003804B809
MNELAIKKNNTIHEAISEKIKPPKLIIFDCDGVLVQSEEITLTLLASMLNDRLRVLLNVSEYFDVVEFVSRYRGRKIGDCLLEVERITGLRLDSCFERQYRERSFEALNLHLKATDGIIEVLQGLNTPYCVASSAPRKKIEHCLKLTELFSYFEGRIFSCYELGAWKPDPRVFLTACEHYNIKTNEALVIEDSLSGIQAAIAANIKVLGFGPVDRHLMLANAGALPFSNMRELPGMLHW